MNWLKDSGCDVRLITYVNLHFLFKPNVHLTVQLFCNFLFLSFFLFFVMVLRFQLRAYTLSRSTSPFFVKGFSR
jgi:hypothetical protein